MRHITFVFIFVLVGCGSDRPAPNPYPSPDSGADTAATDAGTDVPLGDATTVDSQVSDVPAATEWCELGSCGGNIEGTFEFADPCSLPRPAASPECRPSQVHYNFRLEGSVQFQAGNAQFRTRRVQSSYYWIPAACTRLSCDRAINFVPPVMGECKAEGDYCDCFSLNAEEWEEEALAYEIDGSDLVLTPAEGDPIHFNYCVSGDLLRYVHPETGEATYARRVE